MAVDEEGRLHMDVDRSNADPIRGVRLPSRSRSVRMAGKATAELFDGEEA
jgi:hypothetical protein